MPYRGVPPLSKPKVGVQPTSLDVHRFIEETNKVLHEVSEERRPQLSTELLTGNDKWEDLGGLTAIKLYAAYDPNLVVHGLGREYRGWRIARIWSASNAVGVTIFEKPNSGEDLTLYLPLRTTEDVYVHLEVF
jgi:hypothetical protein